MAVDRENAVDEAQAVVVGNTSPELEVGDLEQTLVEERDTRERAAPQKHGRGLADPVLVEAGGEELVKEVAAVVDPLQALEALVRASEPFGQARIGAFLQQHV